MVLADYLKDVAETMRRESDSIRRDFASHRLSAGSTREDIVAKFLQGHLPSRFRVDTGLLFSSDGTFSNQADVLVLDGLNNAPLYGSGRAPLWPVEAAYAMIEVKASLAPRDITEAIEKGRRYKRLPRRPCDATPGKLDEALFVIWGFDAPAAKTLKDNLNAALRDVPRVEQPDLLVVPDRIVVRSGSYLVLNTIGQPGSRRRADLEAQHGPDLTSLIDEPCVIYDCGPNSLLAWYVWFDSWLRRAGPRSSDPRSYLPLGDILGKRI